MLLSKMRVRALSPTANEVIIQRAPDDRAYYWYETCRPFLHQFCAGFRSDALNDFRNQAVDDILLEQLPAEVNSSRTGGSDPEFSHFFVSVVFESINQT